MRTNILKYILLLAGALSMPASSFASPIFVTNPSFETLFGGGLTACFGAGCGYTFAAIPGWTKTGSTGQFRPGTAPNPYYTSLSDGSTQAFSDGGMLSQTVLPTVQLGWIYTLQVDLGYRLDLGFGGAADLLINGVSYTATGTTPVRGTFGTFTATYIGLAADVGKPIMIELTTNLRQANFDNVRLDALEPPTSAPEPSTLLLFGPALLLMRRRNRQSTVRR